MSSEGEDGDAGAGFKEVGVLGPEANARAVVTWQGTKVAVARFEGEIYAYEDTCPHQGASLAEGQIENGIVHCPWHGWRFELASGKCRDSSYGAIKLFDVRIEEERILLRARERTQ